MKTINLSYKHKSDIAYKKIQYPDGQNDIRILNSFEDEENELSVEKSKEIENSNVVIISRCNNFIDLEYILCATECLREIGCKNISLQIPFLFSARADRKFVSGGSSYLENITSAILNLKNYTDITSVDVHNFKRTKEVLNNFTNISFLPSLINWAIYDIKRTDENKKIYIISPDKGAEPRTAEVCYSFNMSNLEVVQCDKKRDMATGKIISTIVPKDDFDGGDCIILDDMIDGGRTFIEIAKVLKSKNCGQIYLVVAHGIFSAGFDELKKYIDKVYLTNSYKDLEKDDFIRQIDVF